MEPCEYCGTLIYRGEHDSDCHLIERMEQLRADRVKALAQVNKNTIRMRLIAVEAQAAGQGTRVIAKLLGVTTRTVYAWLRG